MSIVETEGRGAVRHVILNRPEKRNAMTDELIAGIGAALAAAAADDAVQCVVVRGEGPMFSAGMDFAALAALAAEPRRLREFRTGVLAAWNVAEEMCKPTFAQIPGGCICGAIVNALASPL